MEFNRIIKLLRKERGITQKQAAEDLGVSQALLSHYEKGIRECGLDFVVRVADYTMECSRSCFSRSCMTISQSGPNCLARPSASCFSKSSVYDMA